MAAMNGSRSPPGSLNGGSVEVPDRSVGNSHCNGHALPMQQNPSSIEDGREAKRQRLSSESERLEEQFKVLCEAITGLNDSTKRDAMNLFQKSLSLLLASIGSLGAGNEDQLVRSWNVCILYCAIKVSSETPTCKLSHLLNAANVRVGEFFRELPQFMQKCDSVLEALYGDACDRLNQAKDLEASFRHLAVLFKSYNRNFNSYFLSSSITKDANTLVTSDQCLQFGWMLFLALRSHVLAQFDLVTCTNGLIAVMAILLIHMPNYLRKFPSYESEIFALRSSSGVNIVGSLCHSYEASEEDVQKMVEKANDMIRKVLKLSYSSKSPDQLDQLADVDSERVRYFEGLLEEGAITSHLEILNKDYEEHFRQRGELDECVFLDKDEALLGLTSDFVSELGAIPGAKRMIDTIASPAKSSPYKSNLLSPARSPWRNSMPSSCNKMLPPTPITSTMTSAKWLRTVISPLPAEPSPELLHYFQLCGADVANQVKNRAQILLEAIFSSERSVSWGLVGGIDRIATLDSIWAEQRRAEALKLYYRVLGSMCRAESERLHCDNLSALVTNERFQRCTLACSAELVLATYKTVSLNFPAVLEPAGITAFDVWKVVESFVRHEETLPRELKRHLNSIEEKILEKLAWEKGSSMYNSLIVAKPDLQSEIHRLGLLAEPMPSLEAIHSRYRISDGNSADKLGPSSPVNKFPISFTPLSGAFSAKAKSGNELMSPAKERQSAFSSPVNVKVRMQPPLQSAFASPQKPSPVGGGETCAETVINIFFQKVLKLAAIRIKTLCESLKQSNSVMEDVYRTVQHVLLHETSLFFKRHTDQIILCCMYGVCKVKQLNVTFKQIIHRYKQNPHDSYVYRTVFFDLPSARPLAKGGQSTGDIIGFYNEIFVPVTKGFLMQLCAPPQVNGTQANDDGGKSDGQLPESPRPSIFSSLPDLSPKKLSANHNVYVSPLRSSKIESLRPPRSLYACVGESTHAYQSPSKDLADINNRVNSRPLGRLDFGDAGLVSDSVVKGSLYPCNTNSTSNHITLDSAPELQSKRLCLDKS